MTLSKLFFREVLIAFILTAVFSVAAMAGQPIPGQAIVKLGQGAMNGNPFKGLDVSVVDSIPGPGLYLVEFPANVDFQQKRTEMLDRQGISDVKRNERVSLIETQQMGISFPDDNVPVHSAGEEPVPYYEQFAISSTSLDSALLLADGEGVRIAIIDNGYDPIHPLFAYGAWAPGYDFIEKDTDPTEIAGDLQGHGTFVTGLARLAAPQGELMIARAFNENGLSDIFTVAAAIYWCIDNDAQVINMSFGTTSDHGQLRLACNAAADAGIVMVASVGNAGLYQAVYPASYDRVIAVSAVNSSEEIADFSNGSEDVDLCAPGVDVYSALPDPYLWGRWSGTSFATPLVSAAAALVKSVDPQGKCKNMENHLRNSARTDLLWGTVATPDPYYGYGLLDTYSAVLQLCMGDMDNSGSLNVSDLESVTRIVTTGETPENGVKRQADMNSDGVVDQKDIDILSNMIFGGGSN